MSYETEIRVSALEEPKVFSINAEHLIFHDTLMDVREIIGFCFGSVVYQSIGYQVGGSHYFRFVDSSNDAIEFSVINSGMNSGNNENVPAQIEYYCWEYFGNRILNDIVRFINSGSPVHIGQASLDRNGIHFTDGRYSGMAQQYTIAWTDVYGYTENGYLLLKSRLDSGISFPIELRTTINAAVLHRLLYYLGTNPNLMGILRGLHPPLA